MVMTSLDAEAGAGYQVDIEAVAAARIAGQASLYFDDLFVNLVERRARSALETLLIKSRPTKRKQRR